MAGKRSLLDKLIETFPEYEKKELYALILCGDVYVEGVREKDPKRLVTRDIMPEIRREPYVSRGGLKLAHALGFWEWDVQGKVFLDAGASTGGFTDCLLKTGAALVYSVDVGFNQLHHSLRRDSRVRNLEKTNIFDLGELEPAADAAVADLSFRSLSGAAAHILSLTTEKRMIALLKPQFEWRNPDPDFKGVVPENRLAAIIRETVRTLADEQVFTKAIIESPIRGTKGNREYLCWLTTEQTGTAGRDFRDWGGSVCPTDPPAL